MNAEKGSGVRQYGCIKIRVVFNHLGLFAAHCCYPAVKKIQKIRMKEIRGHSKRFIMLYARDIFAMHVQRNCINSIVSVITSAWRMLATLRSEFCHD